MTDYIISFKQSNGKFRVYSSSTKEISTLDLLPAGNGKINKFIMLNHNDNDASDEDLMEYAKNFKRWCKELFNSPLKINYSNYYSDYTAVTCTFNRYCKKNYSSHKPITATDIYDGLNVVRTLVYNISEKKIAHLKHGVMISRINMV